jgi:hypothetical protein
LKITLRPALELRCPFCHDAVRVEEARICPACSGAQHVACDLAHGGCAICVVYGQRAGPRPRRGPGFRARHRQQGWARARSYGVAAVALFLASLLAGCLIPLSLTPYPSVWTALALLTSLVAGGGSLTCLGISLSGACRGLWGARWAPDD